MGPRPRCRGARAPRRGLPAWRRCRKACSAGGDGAFGHAKAAADVVRDEFLEARQPTRAAASSSCMQSGQSAGSSMGRERLVEWAAGRARGLPERSGSLPDGPEEACPESGAAAIAAPCCFAFRASRPPSRPPRSACRRYLAATAESALCRAAPARASPSAVRRSWGACSASNHLVGAAAAHVRPARPRCKVARAVELLGGVARGRDRRRSGRLSVPTPKGKRIDLGRPRQRQSSVQLDLHLPHRLGEPGEALEDFSGASSTSLSWVR